MDKPDTPLPEPVKRLYEKRRVRQLGEEIGYGNLMHVARDQWREALDHAGGEFAVGPCVALTVPCGCTYPCDWCNGCGWITPKVKELQKENAELRDLLEKAQDYIAGKNQRMVEQITGRIEN